MEVGAKFLDDKVTGRPEQKLTSEKLTIVMFSSGCGCAVGREVARSSRSGDVL